MKPTVKIAAALTPDGGEMVLYKHDRDFLIRINGEDLMLSRHHESELELARLGCAHLAGSNAPSILIGGLGMGYTLRQALDILSPNAKIVVGELLGAVVEWNRQFFGELNDRPLSDGRVELRTGDIVDLILQSRSRFNAILLDVDNGPSALTDSGNSHLYSYEGILACRSALRTPGCLAVWSAGPCKEFEQLLMDCRFHVRRFKAPAHKGGKSQSRSIWVASPDRSILPCGSGETPQLCKNDLQKSRGRK